MATFTAGATGVDFDILDLGPLATAALTTMRLIVPAAGGPEAACWNPSPERVVETPDTMSVTDVVVAPDGAAVARGPRSRISKSTPVAPAVNVAMLTPPGASPPYAGGHL